MENTNQKQENDEVRRILGEISHLKGPGEYILRVFRPDGGLEEKPVQRFYPDSHTAVEHAIKLTATTGPGSRITVTKLQEIVVCELVQTNSTK
jgi:hypothetical protein